MQGRFLEVTQALGGEMPPNMAMLSLGLQKVAQRGILSDEDLVRTMPLLHEIARYVLLGEGGAAQVALAMEAAGNAVAVASFGPIPPELEAHDAELETIYPTLQAVPEEWQGDDREEALAPEGDPFEVSTNEAEAAPAELPAPLEAGPPMPGWAPFEPAVEVPNPDAIVPAEGE
jgi:hypothetical protein